MDNSGAQPALCPGSASSTGRTSTTADTTTATNPNTCSRTQRQICDMWTVQICPTIGGAFELNIHPKENVDGLKRSISKKLKIPKEKISLLHRESILREGRLCEHGVCDGSTLKLLPNVESGLMSQKAENTVMQALENLSEGQVHEFLTGKSPLTLAMRLGDHMMFVQLQLSTNSPGYRRASSSNYRCSKNKTMPPPTVAASSSSSTTSSLSSSQRSQSSQKQTRPTVPVTPAAGHLGMMRPPSEAAVAPVMTAVPAPVPSPPPASPAPSTSSSPSASPIEDMMRGARDSLSPVSCSDSSSDTSDSELPVLDSAALAQAKRNLQQKLKEISQLRGAQQKEQEPEPGAIIESMQHLGHGVYSGTFSGALNPALQDRDGKPKRSISTIIHILNDLLGASPQYRAHLHASRRRRLAAASAAAAAAQGSTTEAGGRLSQENEATRGKMEQIQMRLEERRQRRKARRQARASPYSSVWPSGVQPGSNMATRDLHQLQQQQQQQQPMEMDANLETTDVGDGVSSYDLSQQEPETKLKNETVVA